jgi:hypothetical protein
MDIKSLKPSSAKLLLHLLVNGGSVEHLSSLMGLLGMDRKTLSVARKQLQDAQLIGEFFPKTVEQVAFALRNFSPVTVSSGENFPIADVEEFPSGEKFPIVHEEKFPSAEKLPTPEDLDEWLVDTPQSKCAAADRSGDRKQQLAALAFAFGEHFPGKPVPSPESLKRLLQLAENSAEDVDTYFARAVNRNPESPYSYVKAMMEREKVQTSAPTRQASDSEPLPNELPDPTPEQRAKWKRNDELLRKAGLIPLDGGDRW